MSKWIEWIEPFGPDSEPVYCRVTEQTAIATQKYTAATLPGRTSYIYATDAEALDDFVTVHWASVIEIA